MRESIAGRHPRQGASLLRWFARPGVRCVLASVLALAVLSFAFEPSIPDVHDGDAPGAAVARSADASTAHAPDVGLVKRGSSTADGAGVMHASVSALDTRVATVSASPDRAPAGGAPADAPAPAHIAHVCHAGHEHVASVSGCTARVVESLTGQERARVLYARRLVSRTTEPPIRPPIA